MEKLMSRVINTQSVGKERNQLVKAIVISIRELMKQGKPDAVSKDLVAFIAIALEAVSETIERTVTPWEKRNYWVKADKFRQDWAWTKSLSDELSIALLSEDWPAIASTTVKIGSKLSHVEVSDRHRMGKPWVGAWDKFVTRISGNK
jgi:hypothetical protein